jgi:hypothetical protein
MSISELAASPGGPGGGWSLESSGGLLAEFRASKQREALEQAHQVWLALEFCAFNSPASIHPAARLPGTEGALALADQSAPGVAESGRSC